MKARQQRMLTVGLAAAGLIVAAALTLTAFRENMMFFVGVSDVVAGEYPRESTFRVGGLVVDGSVQRQSGSLQMNFRVTDLNCEIPISYEGVVPDLFREGQGVVAHGRMSPSGTFVADEILAKHDENYMAPEVAESMAEHVQTQTAAAQARGGDCDIR